MVPGDGKKYCPGCKQHQALRFFHKNRTAYDGHQSYCRDCFTERRRVNAYHANYRKKRVLQDPDYLLRRVLKDRYGITLEDYQRTLKAQGGVCAICRCVETRQVNGKLSRLSVDHDHVTNQIRGLLCHRCNARLAVIDNKDWCAKAERYLATPTFVKSGDERLG